MQQLGQVMAVFAEVYGSSLSLQLYSTLMLVNHADVAAPVYNNIGAQLAVTVSISAATSANSTSSICDWLGKHSRNTRSFTVTLMGLSYNSSNQAIPLLALGNAVTDLHMRGRVEDDGFAVTLSHFLGCCRALRSVCGVYLSPSLTGSVAKALLAALGRRGSSLVELEVALHLNGSLRLPDVNSLLAQMTGLKRLKLGAASPNGIDDLNDKDDAMPALASLTCLTKMDLEVDEQAGCYTLEKLPSSVQVLCCSFSGYEDQGVYQYDLSHLTKVIEMATVPLCSPQIMLPPNLVSLGAALGFVSPLLPLTSLTRLDLLVANRPGGVRQKLQQLTVLTGLQQLSLTYDEPEMERDFLEAWPLLPITELRFPCGLFDDAAAHLTRLSRLQRLEISLSSCGNKLAQALAKLPPLELVLDSYMEWL